MKILDKIKRNKKAAIKLIFEKIKFNQEDDWSDHLFVIYSFISVDAKLQDSEDDR